MSEDEAKKRVLLTLGVLIHQLKSKSKMDDIEFLIGTITGETYIRENVV